MSTPAHFDSEIISQTVKAQSSRVPTPLLDDPYVAIRGGSLKDKVVSRIPLTNEKFEASKPSDTRTASSHSLTSSDSTAPLSPDHPLTQASPTPTPT
ncbi:hypothetical protein Tco_1153203 [Tanacetum coccineum]